MIGDAPDRLPEQHESHHAYEQYGEFDFADAGADPSSMPTPGPSYAYLPMREEGHMHPFSQLMPPHSQPAVPLAYADPQPEQPGPFLSAPLLTVPVGLAHEQQQAPTDYELAMQLQRQEDLEVSLRHPQQFAIDSTIHSQEGAGSQETPAAIRENFSRILQAKGPLASWPVTQHQASTEGFESLPSSLHAQPSAVPLFTPATVDSAGAEPPTSSMPSISFRAAEEPSAPHVVGPAKVIKVPPTASIPPTSVSAPCALVTTSTSLRHQQNQDTWCNTAVPLSVGGVASVKSGAVDELSFLRMFPQLFSFCCVLGFLVPIWLTVHLGHDRTVVYFLGSWSRLAMFLPIVWVFAHIQHVKRHQPSKPAVLASLLVPSVVLMGLNDATMTAGSDKADQLFSTDCDTFAGKRELQHAWEAANELYMTCLEETLRQTPSDQNLTIEVAKKSYRIQDCDEYVSQHYAHKETWEYLWYLEEEQQCSGWCTIGPQIWSFNEEPKDSCSVAAAQVFTGKVTRISQQVTLFSTLVLVTTSVSLIGVGPLLRARGIDW